MRDLAKRGKPCPGWSFGKLREKRQIAEKGRLLKAHLEALGVPHDVKIYDEAGHSYMSSYPKWIMALAPFSPPRACYDEAAAEESWRRMLAFFRAHLGATPGAP